MRRTVCVAATQMACTWDQAENLHTAERLIREASAQGAQVILPQKMSSNDLFAFSDWKPEYFA